MKSWKTLACVLVGGIASAFLLPALGRMAVEHVSHNMRAPGSGVLGRLAIYLMTSINHPTIEDAVSRLAPSAEDTWLEIGAGTGHGLLTLSKLATPRKTYAVEISPTFRAQLVQPASLVGAVISDADAGDLSFLKDGSVTKVLAVNVVYFLDPLERYVRELARVTQKGARVLFACKFALVRGKPSPPFVHQDRAPVVAALEADGRFVVSVEDVDLGNLKHSYCAITATRR